MLRKNVVTPACFVAIASAISPQQTPFLLSIPVSHYDVPELFKGFIASIGRGFIKLCIFVADVCLLRRAAEALRVVHPKLFDIWGLIQFDPTHAG
jgi:hypothetical protein